MTKRRITSRAVAIILVTIALSGVVGCVEALIASHAAAFGGGLIVGQLTAPTVTETQCYLNGEPVDCSVIP